MAYEVYRVYDNSLVEIVDAGVIFAKEGYYKFAKNADSKGIAFFPIQHYYVKKVNE